MSEVGKTKRPEGPLRLPKKQTREWVSVCVALAAGLAHFFWPLTRDGSQTLPSALCLNGAARFGGRIRCWVPNAPRAHREDGVAQQSVSHRALFVLGTPMDINEADPETLTMLGGVGPKLARRIVARRKKTPFVETEELQEVRGIGPKLYAKIRAFVRVTHR